MKGVIALYWLHIQLYVINTIHAGEIV